MGAYEIIRQFVDIFAQELILKYVVPDYVFGLTVILLLPIAILAPKGLVPLFVITIILLLIGQKQTGFLKISPGVVVVSFTLLLVLAVLSAIWSLTTGESIRTAVSLAAVLIGGVILLRASVEMTIKECNVFQILLIIGGGLGFALLSFEQSQNAVITRMVQGIAGKEFNPDVDNTLTLNPASSIAVLLFWPWAYTVYIRFGKLTALVLIVLVAGSLLLSESVSPVFALFSGFTVFAFSLAFPKKGLPAISVLIITGILTAPIIAGFFPDPLSSQQNDQVLKLPPFAFTNSIVHRFAIWKTTIKHVKERPILGHGFDTSRALYNSKNRIKLQFFPGQPDQTWTGYFEPIPLHPHNGILQIWLELGFAGALILSVFVFGLISAVWRNVIDKTGRATALGLIVTAIFLFSASFGAWQNWWMSGLFILAAITIPTVKNSAVQVGNGLNSDR